MIDKYIHGVDEFILFSSRQPQTTVRSMNIGTRAMKLPLIPLHIEIMLHTGEA